MKMFHKVLNIAVNLFSVSICFTSLFFISIANADQSDQTIQLTPVQTLTSKTLVTTGIPFAPGQLKNVDLLRVYDDEGNNVPIFVKPTLFWHWKNAPKNTIRAVKVQFYLKKGTNATTYRFSFNSARDTTNDISEVNYDEGTKVSSDPKKTGMRHPIVFSIMSVNWLEQSQLIPPFKGMNNDHQQTFWNGQYAWASGLDFTQMSFANWLYDRVSSLYKGCMRNSDMSCYQEAFVSYRFWNKHITREGRCLGGLGISDIAVKSCDTKYVYVEPIKIHLALTGDDTKHDEELLNNMIELVRTGFYYQADSSDLYDSEKEKFTERAAGLSILNYVNAYQLTAQPKILGYIDEHLESLYQHQNNNPDKLPADGSFRHSWRVHEGKSFPGNGNLDDRRFSPWMTENIMDGLWQAYFLVEDERIPEMIRFASEAMEKWGFANSKGYLDKFGDSLHDVPGGGAWRNGCNKNGEMILYSASSVASSAALVKGQGWYTDSHTPEGIFSLAVGYYFETDATKAKALKDRITRLHDTYLKKCGSASSKTKRAFNWGNRSNYWGTYLWILSEKGEKLPSVDDGIVIPDPIIPDKPTAYANVFDNSFEQTISDDWDTNDVWFINDKQLYSSEAGVLYLNNDINAKNYYRMELNIAVDESESADKGVAFSNNEDGFYSVRVKFGRYGGVYIYKHSTSWNLGGKLVAQKKISNVYGDKYKLVVLVKDKIATVYLNGEKHITYQNQVSFTGVNNGVFSLGNRAGIKSFKMEYGKPDPDNDDEPSPPDPTVPTAKEIDLYFDELDEAYWQQSTWDVVNNSVNVSRASQLTLKNAIDLGSKYSISMDVSANESGKYHLYLLFNNSEDFYYSARIYSGRYGGIYLYEHPANSNSGGKIVAKTGKQKLLNSNYVLTVNVSDKTVKILLDNEEKIEYEFETISTGKNVGLYTTGTVENAFIESLNIDY